MHNDSQDAQAPEAAEIAAGAQLAAAQIRNIIEAALLAADEPLTADRLYKLFASGELAEEGGRAQIREALKCLASSAADRGVEIKRVASGYRAQVKQDLSPWVSRLWEERPPRYTRALLETLSLIAYKQPTTRGDIEEVRGVTVSPNIMRTLLERGWIREVGHREVPGRPSMYGTTKEFLDYFNLSSLDQLPSLPEVRALIEPTVLPEEQEQAKAVPDTEVVAGAASIEASIGEVLVEETPTGKHAQAPAAAQTADVVALPRPDQED